MDFTLKERENFISTSIIHSKTLFIARRKKVRVLNQFTTIINKGEIEESLNAI